MRNVSIVESGYGIPEAQNSDMGESRRKRKSKPVSVESTKVLRSRTREKAKTSESKLMRIVDGENDAKKSGRGRKKGIKKLPVNEFSRIRTHLRYLVHRINYEKNLIDAYSCEGWKGQSVEKIKPEKELERARSQIFRFKLKIRDLFQRLDASLNQGKLPETLFDTEGKIDCEDIFCAKCGSKDFTIDNDIILCDGACERGFHQFCLVPPLLKEDIPPGDEGWICYGCSCKIDCLGMLNDFQGSRLSLFDNWEKVFPEEAAASASGKNTDDIYTLRSRDSEDDDDDDDYNPNNKEVGHKASENDKEMFLGGLPSDDSEDDDFDPSDVNDNQPIEHDSSSAYFSSDSDDLGGIVNEENEGYGFSLPNYSNVDASASMKKSKGESLDNKLVFLIDSDAIPVVSEKRRVERLDYKKLHDEAYGDATSNSSDEDYSDGNEDTLNVEGHQSFEGQSSNNVNVDAQKSFGVSSSSRNASRLNKRLGKAAIQKLVECFKENQYPEKDVIESLANKSGLTVQQVSRWFVNSRWSFRHTSRMESKLAWISAPNVTQPPSPPPPPPPPPKLEPETSCNSSHNAIAEMRPLSASPSEIE